MFPFARFPDAATARRPKCARALRFLLAALVCLALIAAAAGRAPGQEAAAPSPDTGAETRALI